MAYNNHKNVIVGAAAVFVSKTSGKPAELPAGASSASGPTARDALRATNSGWRDLGYTTDGIEVSYEPDYGEVTVDQLLDSAKMFKQGMRVSVNTTLSEATLENLMVAWGQSESTLKGNEDDSAPTTPVRLDITGGELHDDPVERSLAFVGKAPALPSSGAADKKRERVYHLRRALQVESSAHSLSRSDATTFPVSFRCLPDSGANLASGGDYGVIIQRVIS